MFSKLSLSRWILLTPLFAVFLLYYLTAFRAIPWWDTPVYILAADTLGIGPPPGSLLLTLLGWLVTRVFGPPDFILSLTAAVLGIITIGSLVFSVKFVINKEDSGSSQDIREKILVTVFLALGILLVGSTSTIWQYSTKFTPYILTACFTTLILWALLHWKARLGHPLHFRWLFVVGLLVGLDFSVHRTNLLLVPGIIAWILIFRPEFLFRWRVWGMLIWGGVTGLLFHLLLIPMAGADPALNFTNPGTLSKFWDYVSLEQYGGSFLVDLFPRAAPFWSYQIMDYLQTFAVNFFPIHGPMGPAGFIPGVLGFFGVGVLIKRDWRTGIGSLGLFLCMSLIAVIYFNLPENFFRPISRHYLSSFVLFDFWMLYGTVTLGKELHNRYRTGLSTSVVGLILITGIVGLVWRNYPERDMSRNRFAEDFAHNMLASLPPNAILFSNGDVDTFPLWYLQKVEGYRQDVTVCNIYLLMTPWFTKQIVRYNPGFPLEMQPEDIDNLRAISWTDSTVMLPGDLNPVKYGLPDSVATQDSLALEVSPSFGQGHLFVHDQIILRILRENRWKRPIYVSIGVSPETASYLSPYLRTEGLVRRVVPVRNPGINTSILETNLMKHYHYDGFNDFRVPINFQTRWAAQNYYGLFLALITTLDQKGSTDQARNILETVEAKIPLERLDLSESIATRIDSIRQVLGQETLLSTTRQKPNSKIGDGVQ